MENNVGDALSRIPEAEVQTITQVQPLWQEEILRSYEGDEVVQQLVTQLLVHP